MRLTFHAFGRIALAGIVTIAIGGILAWLAGADPLLTYYKLVEGAFGDRYELAETVVRSLPLLVVALGVAPALRAGVFTVGSEGQLAIGALTSTAAILAASPAPAATLLAVGIAAGAAGGVAWALIPGLLRAYGRVNEILSTLLLNYLAGLLLLWLLRTHMNVQEEVATPRSESLPKAAMIPNLLEGTRLHWGVLAALLGIAGLAWWVRSIRGFGYDVHATHPGLAARMGVSGKAAVINTMIVAGGAAGLAGWLQVAGLQGTLYASVAGGLGFAGVLVAILGNLRPFGIAVAALFFGALTTGADGMQVGTGVPASIAKVFEGLILLAATLIVAARRRDIGRLMLEQQRAPGP